jgi:hypothetical protein
MVELVSVREALALGQAPLASVGLSPQFLGLGR